MKLIIITWFPASGKTTLAKKISEKLKIPFYSKDSFKEILYDEIWYDTWEEKKIFEITALKILYHIFEKYLIKNNSIILEANFYSQFSTKVFNDFKEKYDFDIVQIKCVSEWKILLKRFKERAFSKERHQWHKDNNMEMIEKWTPIFLKWEWDKLHIWWKYIELDTNDFEKIDYEKLYEKIENI